MPPAAAPSRGALARLRYDLILPVGLICSVLVLLIPLPAAVMDVLLAGNLAVAVMMLLTTVYVRTPLEFSVFPTLLLATTLARLVLNVATTRLILTRAASEGLLAAGQVVKSFGEFVAGEQVVVGLIVFSIIVVIQFVVITKGATRISEVAARFALDGMPGKQMAIDADLNAGLIDQAEAQRRRAKVSEQADFFGAMDGASKFVRGDAIAGIVITLVNIAGGLYIGVIDAGMSIKEASLLFTRLTIGDGLVSQVPAFLISLAAGLLVTRSTSESDLPKDFVRQLVARPQVLTVTAAFLAMLIFTGLPTLPLLILSGGCLAVSVGINRHREQETLAEKAIQKSNEKPRETRVEDYLAVDPMELEIGIGLIRMADPKRGGDLLDRIQRVRQSVAAEIGIVLPKVRVRDNVRLGNEQYRIKISDMVVAEGATHPGLLLAMDAGLATGDLEGLATTEPAFGMPSVWIEPSRREQAERLGYSVVEPASVLATHLTEVIRGHADELLTRDATKHLLDQLRLSSPTVVDELLPGQMKLADVQRVLQLLLREGVTIRNLGPILETLGDHISKTKDPEVLTEHVRQRLTRALSSRYRDSQKRLFVVTLDPALEDQIAAGLENSEHGTLVRLPPEAVESLCGWIAAEVPKLSAGGHPPVVLVSPMIRAALKQMTAARLPQLAVLSYNEISRDTKVESVAQVTDEILQVS